MKKIFIAFLAIIAISATAQKKKQQLMSCCFNPDASSMKKFAGDMAFQSAHDVPAPFVFEANEGTALNFKTTDGKDGYAMEWVAKEPTKNYLIVVHEWWGLNDYVKQMSQQLYGDLGNVNVIAIDMYDNHVAATAEEAGKMMAAVTQAHGEAIVKGLYATLGADAKIATIGWCFGGGWSLQASLLAGKQAVGCVMYYGMPEKDVKKLSTLHADVLGLFANQDKWLTPAVVAQFKADMEKAHKKLELHQYDADHAFANPSQTQRYNKEAADDAYKNALAFLKERIK